MARKKQPPVGVADKELIGSLLRDLRKAAGYRSVETAASREACPASRQTIYAYERGDLVPSLPQFLELVEFYVLEAPHGRGAKPEADIRSQGVAAVTHVLTLQAYHVPHALELVARMRPDGARGA
jgi:DNA-binding XRE family transcriptional regulator